MDLRVLRLHARSGAVARHRGPQPGSPAGVGLLWRAPPDPTLDHQLTSPDMLNHQSSADHRLDRLVRSRSLAPRVVPSTDTVYCRAARPGLDVARQQPSFAQLPRCVGLERVKYRLGLSRCGYYRVHVVGPDIDRSQPISASGTHLSDCLLNHWPLPGVEF